jgi:hypothetical protein
MITLNILILQIEILLEIVINIDKQGIIFDNYPE